MHVRRPPAPPLIAHAARYRVHQDAFEELRTKGMGIPIVVREEAPRASETAAEFWLRQREVSDFLALVRPPAPTPALRGPCAYV